MFLSQCSNHLKLSLYRTVASRTMVFACQNDPFLKEFKTSVVSCESAKLGDKEGFELILEDTILFPEGGGQVGSYNRWIFSQTGQRTNDLFYIFLGMYISLTSAR